jgi:F0F1-type ATP synthase delta subunit
MFKAKVWAETFAACCSGAAGTNAFPAYAEEAFKSLKAYIRCSLALPGFLSGRKDADRLGIRIQSAMARSGFVRDKGSPEIPGETARRFFILMVRRDCFRYHDMISAAIEELINKSKGLVRVILESAFAPDEELVNLVREKVLEQAGRRRSPEEAAVRETAIKTYVNPELIGGVRLRIGNVLFDASVKTQLRKMAADLSIVGVDGRQDGEFWRSD